MIPTILVKHKVHMGWPPAVTIEPRQQLPDRPIAGDRIANGNYGLEPELAFRVRTQNSTTSRLRPIRVLHVVEAAAVRLPDIHLDALDGVSLAILDGAETE